jgi:hypothetical protein
MLIFRNGAAPGSLGLVGLGKCFEDQGFESFIDKLFPFDFFRQNAPVDFIFHFEDCVPNLIVEKFEL